LLGDRELLPNGSPAGYLQQPPLMLTTLDALPAFYNGHYRDDGAGDAPISAIRVRVAGVSGFDDVSRERVRLVAEQISEATGLQVDVTMGSSPAPQVIQLPAGEHGRPELALRELWTKKGVAAIIAEAVDRKSLILFILVLLVCAAFVGNAASASVRARQQELGVLSAVGWTRRALSTVIVGEMIAIGLGGGLIGALAAWLIGGSTSLTVSWARAAVAVPASVALTLVAGVIPAWLASRTSPMAALRPHITLSRRAQLRLGVAGLAIANLFRRPGRAVSGGSAIALSAAAFTFLLAVTVQFQGSLVGTLLSEAIAVQVRAPDIAAVLAMLVLAAVAIADILYLNVRDRASEFATLRATGWTESNLARLIAVEGILLGLMGGVVGAGIGTAATAWFAGADSVVRLLPFGLATIGVCIGIAMLALIVPLATLRRLTAVQLLSEE
jgi:ABC-type antimicrobial peptide transport system permease subunit